MAPTWRAMRAVALEVRAHRFVSLAYFVQVSLERFDCDAVRCGGLLELFECFLLPLQRFARRIFAAFDSAQHV